VACDYINQIFEFIKEREFFDTWDNWLHQPNDNNNRISGNGFLYKSLSLLIYSGDPLLHHLSLVKENPTFLHASDQAIMHWWCKTKQEKKIIIQLDKEKKFLRPTLLPPQKCPHFSSGCCTNFGWFNFL